MLSASCVRWRRDKIRLSHILVEIKPHSLDWFKDSRFYWRGKWGLQTISYPKALWGRVYRPCHSQIGWKWIEALLPAASRDGTPLCLQSFFFLHTLNKFACAVCEYGANVHATKVHWMCACERGYAPALQRLAYQISCEHNKSSSRQIECSLRYWHTNWSCMCLK